MTNLATRAAAALAEQTTAQEAEAAAGRAEAGRQASQAGEAEQRRLMAATAGLRQAAADALQSMTGEASTPDQWAPLDGTTSSTVTFVTEGVEFAAWVLHVGHVPQLLLGARRAGSSDTFQTISDLPSLGSFLNSNPIPATAGTDPEGKS